MKTNLSAFMKSAKRTISKHSPEILTGIGVAGMWTTVVLTYKTAPKIESLLDERRDELGVDKLPPVEIAKTVWRPCVAPIVTGVASTACIIGGVSVGLKRNAALTAAYEISRNAFVDYRDKVVETIGEKKEQEIRESVAKDKVKNVESQPAAMVVTGQDAVRCVETISMQKFWSTPTKLKDIQNKLNARMLQGEDYVSLNEFYYEVGAKPTKLGNEMGWNISDGLIDFVFGSTLDENDNPVLSIDYLVAPRYGYGDLH